MRSTMLRGPSVRTKSFRKVQKSTRLPSALLREMEDLEGDDAVSDTAEASNEMRTASPATPVAKEGTQKTAARAAAAPKTGSSGAQETEASAAQIQCCKSSRIRDGNNRASARQDSGVAWDATLSDTTKMNSSGASYEACRLPLRSGSTDAAVTAPKNLKQKQQQERENDALHHELQMLEARLGINNKKGCKKSSNANAKLRRELEADGFDLELQDILDNILDSGRSGAKDLREIDSNEPGKERVSGESDEPRKYGDEFERSGLPVGGESISALAEAFNGEKLHGGCDPLHEELQLYEKLLGVSQSGSSKNDGIREKKRRKLREELKQDGFDLELQDMLDSILGMRGRMSTAGFEYKGAADGGTPVGLDAESEPVSVEDSDSDKATVCVPFISNSSPVVSKLACYQAETGPNRDTGIKQSGIISKATAAPLRRRLAEGVDAIPSVYLEAVRVGVVRAIKRVSEDNVNTVLRQLLRVLRCSAAELQRGYESKEQADEALHAHNISVREILCDRLTQSCLEGRSSDAPMIAIKAALCCALSKMWDIELCRNFLMDLAGCFLTHFWRALLQQKKSQKAFTADTSFQRSRHALVGICCLYDFGFVSPRMLVELIFKITGLQEDSKPPLQRNNGTPDFRVELVLLLLRLEGGKLHQDDPSLFSSTWKKLHGIVQQYGDDFRLHLEGQHFSLPEQSIAGAELQDCKDNKQDEALMHIKASQHAMKRWLSSSSVFGPSFLSTEYRIDGSWGELQQGQRPEMVTQSAVAAHLHHHKRTEISESIPVARSIGSPAIHMQEKAALLRFNTELQQSIFKCLMMANSPDAALQLLQRTGHLSLKKTTIRLHVADLRIVRFLNFGAVGKEGPGGLSGRLGIFLRELH
ncbi:LOW QUALITY PROTEIN: hypothetical protein, conserved [Eimeria necatrix]|uniref:MI domain-containing protein n=1 Tax=Eimeria necatrix TaxID=51315 RepID=U6MKB5_9EIME|nr:LOW QUALITY PROTEIN: hypothetical protein, conserved [Eimeria necatrix]CDJ64461.1 hypothetical protein, conserved [Eimeria necatrix]